MRALGVARRQALLGGVVFSPASISGLVAWYDASYAASLYQERSSPTTPASADGNPIGTWQDKSGNARHLTALADASRPTLKTAIQNGLSVARFDDVDDYMTAAFAFIVQPTTFFFVVKPAASSSYGRQTFIDTQTSSQCITSVSDGYVYEMYAGTFATKSGSAGFKILTAQFNGASSLLRINQSESTVNPGTASVTGLTVGAYSSGTRTLNGDFGELLFYSGALSAAQILQVESYLNTKWAVY